MELLRFLLPLILPINFLLPVSALPHFFNRRDDTIIAPKVMIVSMVGLNIISQNLISDTAC